MPPIVLSPRQGPLSSADISLSLRLTLTKTKQSGRAEYPRDEYVRSLDIDGIADSAAVEEAVSKMVSSGIVCAYGNPAPSMAARLFGVR